MRHETDRINRLARKAAADYHREQAKRFVECAVNLCATSMPLSDVAKLLRDHAAILEEYG